MRSVDASPRAARAIFCPTTSAAASTSSASSASVYERYGFEPLETPAFENIETLLGKYGDEGNKLIFKILKRGEHEASGEADLALRYDLTVPLARVVAQYQNEAAEVLQALSDSAGVARRSPGARPVSRVLSVRHRQPSGRRRRSSKRN